MSSKLNSCANWSDRSRMVPVSQGRLRRIWICRSSGINVISDTCKNDLGLLLYHMHMKGLEEISPWKVTERMETKDFQEDNHCLLPKMSMQLRRSSL